MKLDIFTRAYLECALFCETDESDESLGKNYAISDFAPEAIERAVKDCTEFLNANIADISKTPDWKGTDSYTNEGYSGLECAGHDFWYTRNGHGVGFWDREYYTQEERDRLTKACRAYGECYAYVGDDGLIYL